MVWTKVALFFILGLVLSLLLIINIIQLLKYKLTIKSKKILFKSAKDKLNIAIIIFFILLIIPSLVLPLLYSKFYIFPGIYSLFGLIVISFWVPINLCICKDGIGVSNLYGRFLTFVPWTNVLSWKFIHHKTNKLLITAKNNKRISNISFDKKLNSADSIMTSKILNKLNLPNM